MFLLTSVFVVVVYKTFSSLGLFYYLKQFYGIRIHVACADPCTDEEVEDPSMRKFAFPPHLHF